MVCNIFFLLSLNRMNKLIIVGLQVFSFCITVWVCCQHIFYYLMASAWTIDLLNSFSPKNLYYSYLFFLRCLLILHSLSTDLTELTHWWTGHTNPVWLLLLSYLKESLHQLYLISIFTQFVNLHVTYKN